MNSGRHDLSAASASSRPSLLRRRPQFRRVWLSEIVSLLGDWMSFVAVSLLALGGEGGGVVALALVMVGHHLPNALFAPVAGVLADRLDRRWLLVATSVAQGALTVAMLGAAVLGSVAAVQVLVFVRASVGALRLPAQSAVLRHVVAEDELLEANAIASATWSVMFAVGMAAGGLIASLGPAAALALDAASFGLSALFLWGLPPMVAEGRPEGGVLSALASVRRDIALAWKHAWDRPPLLDAVLAKTPVHLANGGALLLLNLVAAERAFAGTAALTLGVLQCVRGAGTGVGPLVGVALVRRGLRGELAATGAAWTTFAAIAAFSVTQHAAALIAVALVWGLGSGANWVLSSAEIQRLSPDRFVGRLSAIDNLVLTVGLCATSLGGAVLVERVGAPGVAAWLGLGAGVLAWIGSQWMLRRRAAAVRGRGAAEVAAEPEAVSLRPGTERR
ncbi:MFS transporter [Sorangium sp. So ce394]|uniref:MFS transporter n=1 Tax=Sorangium sp. So ce394 TaxID=3133310 RepID=UPI003F5BF9FD